MKKKLSSPGQIAHIHYFFEQSNFCVPSWFVVVAEWEVGHGGRSQDMEVEIRQEAISPKADSTPLLASNSSTYPVAGKLSHK